MHQPHPSLEGEFILNKRSEEKPSQKSETSLHKPHPKKPAGHLHFYSQFMQNPDNVRITHQGPNEKILLVLRSHWIVNVVWLLSIAFLTIIPIIFIPAIQNTLPSLNVGVSAVVLFLLFYYLLLFGYSLLRFTLWFFHTTIVTDTKIVDIDIHNILSRDVVEAPIESVIDVGYTQIGTLASVLNYGNLKFQTNTLVQNLEIEKVPQPAKVARIVADTIAMKGKIE